jgi:AAA+ superfamily predicted ATPase
MSTVETRKNIKYQDAMEEVGVYVKARVPIIWVQTSEEIRFIEELKARVCDPQKRELFLWSCYHGIIPIKNKIETTEPSKSSDWQDSILATKSLKKINDYAVKTDDVKGAVFVLKDFHVAMADPIVIRQLRDMYTSISDNFKCIIIVSPFLGYGQNLGAGIHPNIEKQVVVVDYCLPTRTQIEARLRSSISQINEKGKYKLIFSDEKILTLSRNLQGLSMIEIDNVIATSLVHLRDLDERKFIHEKKNLIKKSNVLEFIESDLNLSDVGGLDEAKAFLSKYANANTPEAEAYGVEPLKGVLLTGIPGTGKSLLAKAIGNVWKVPLLHFDVGKVMTGLVGGSEAKMREVIQQAEALAPCVLWLDEVEKSLSGTKSSNFSDGGTLARVFGTLLTAMQDGMKGVTLVATANDISMLPPEFIRRFNEVFFVDLPGPEERWEILGIHLAKKKRPLEQFEKDKQALLDATEHFTGAEIEKAVKDALVMAFYGKSKDITSAHLLRALADTKPLFTVMGEKIAKSREWAKNRARYASSYAAQQAGLEVQKQNEKVLDLDAALDDMNEIKTPEEKKKSRVSAKTRMAGLADD